jgi:hypothetical protein
MSITFKKNFDEKKLLAAKLEKARAALDVATQFEVTEIKRNMDAGRGFDGSAFAAYSTAYASYRRKIGRGTTPDLTLTGKLRSSIQAKAAKLTGKGVQAGIFILDTPGTQAPRAPSKRKRRASANQRPASSVEKAHFVQEGRRPRKFFGLSAEAIERIVKRVQEAFNK